MGDVVSIFRRKVIKIYKDDLQYKYKIIATMGSDRIGVLYNTEEIIYTVNGKEFSLEIDKQLTFTEMLLVSKVIGMKGGEITEIIGRDDNNEFIKITMSLERGNEIIIESNANVIKHLDIVIGFNYNYFQTPYKINRIHLENSIDFVTIADKFVREFSENTKVLYKKNLKYNGKESDSSYSLIGYINEIIMIGENEVYILYKDSNSRYDNNRVNEIKTYIHDKIGSDIVEETIDAD